MASTNTTPKPHARRRWIAGTPSAPGAYTLTSWGRRPPAIPRVSTRSRFDGAPGDNVGCRLRPEGGELRPVLPEPLYEGVK